MDRDTARGNHEYSRYMDEGKELLKTKVANQTDMKEGGKGRVRVIKRS